jgi:hypothetical protein
VYGSPETPQTPLLLLLLLLELLLLELLPLELLLAEAQTPRSLDWGVQVDPPVQPVLVVGSQSCTQVPWLTAVVEVPAELQVQPGPQRSVAPQAMSSEQADVSLAMLPPWKQTPMAAAPPSPPFWTLSSGKQVPSLVPAALQGPS